MTDSLELPSLRITNTRPIGKLVRILRPASTQRVVGSDQVRVSARRTEQVHELDSGERVIVTSRKSCPRPNDIDGVLHVDEHNRLTWASHKHLEAASLQEHEVGLRAIRDSIHAAWSGQFRFRAEETNPDGTLVRPGLRPPQLGALFAIGAHWSIHHTPATIVMPTGTGKTETMLASLVALVPGPLLVVVPSKALRTQTVRKFASLGLLASLSLIEPDCPLPIVGIVTRRPKSMDDLALFNECNVIVSTVPSLAQGTAIPLAPEIAARVSTLIVDEAHHVAASTWSHLREHFTHRRILQYTATPFRRDGKLVDGDVIYSYPLRRAQLDGYFKPISFEPVCEIDPDISDRAIAMSAVAKLRDDRSRELSHIVMARCATIERAEAVHAIYQELASEHEPVLVHSEMSNPQAATERLRDGSIGIVVCVDMLGEGFDLPELKIAAIHDTHKSLAVLLQFAGRFTRVSTASIGDATVIANIANQDVSLALERLYSEDADWNLLLSEFSSQAVREHAELVAFLRDSQRLDDDTLEPSLSISSSLLRPKFSIAAYKCDTFHPKRFHHGLSASRQVAAAWLNETTSTLFFVTRLEPTVPWSRSKELLDRQWDLFVLHHDSSSGLLYVHSSDKASLHEDLANAVAGGQVSLLYGDQVFRALGGIARLRFQNVGVRKHGRRNIRYAMYTGADVAEALTASQRTGSVKANLSGDGYRDGDRVTIGCSYKGRIWSKDQGPIRAFLNWCNTIGPRLLDDTIDTARIIENVLIPKEQTGVPDKHVLVIEWPHEILSQAEERVLLCDDATETSIAFAELSHASTDRATNSIHFTVAVDNVVAEYSLIVGGERGFRVAHRSGPEFRFKCGRLDLPLDQYLSDYPPLVLFVDLAELDGHLLYEPTEGRELAFPPERFETWEWSQVDITKESIWKDGVARSSSIQARAAEQYRQGGFDLIFDDDSSGEAADLICLKEEEDRIRLALIHCKFTTSQDPGRRVKDVVEVCSQAVRSGKWIGQFKRLCKHISTRERRLRSAARPTRFLVGNSSTLNALARTSRFKEVRTEIVIVQPGLSQSACSPDQAAVLAAAHSYLSETVAVSMDVVCSA